MMPLATSQLLKVSLCPLPFSLDVCNCRNLLGSGRLNLKISEGRILSRFIEIVLGHRGSVCGCVCICWEGLFLLLPLYLNMTLKCNFLPLLIIFGIICEKS